MSERDEARCHAIGAGAPADPEPLAQEAPPSDDPPSPQNPASSPDPPPSDEVVQAVRELLDDVVEDPGDDIGG